MDLRPLQINPEGKEGDTGALCYGSGNVSLSTSAVGGEGSLTYGRSYIHSSTYMMSMGSCPAYFKTQTPSKKSSLDVSGFG